MKINRLYKFVLTILFIITSVNILRAQYIDSLLDILDTKYKQEKVHIHFDKAYYNAGETIWFKAYVIADNLPVSISKTMYADLLDDQGRLLQRKMMPLLMSGGASHFDLPDTISSSRLYLRAYTQWMLNFDSSLLYMQPVNIVPSKSTVKKIPPPVLYSVKFFPEGGDLVAGIRSKLAFKATDNQGVPFTVKGEIVDGKGKKITDFSSIHNGMGYFLFTPSLSEKYIAVWKDKTGLRHETILPAAMKQGMVLSVTLSDNQLNYTLQRPDTVDPVYTTYSVVAQMHQRLVYSARINMQKKTMITAPIITDSLPNGVLQVTVFNQAMSPVAERILYINNNNYFFITDLHATEKNLSKRGHNTLQIDVGDSLFTNLSVSVTDADINPVTGNEENIYSRFLLSSDVKGYVYNAAYYFSSDVDSVKQHLDLVMLTNGWRRFKWQDVLAAKWPTLTYYPEDYLSISGRIYGVGKGLLYNKSLTGLLKTKSAEGNLFNIPINDKGEFKKEGLYFFDTAKLYYQINNDKDKILTTTASFAFQNSFVKLPVQPLSLLSSLYALQKTDSLVLLKNNRLAALQRDQNESNKIKTLSVVEVRSRQKSLKEKMDEEYTSGFFSGGDGYTFTTEDDPFARSAMSILNYLQGKVAGLQISTTGVGGATWRGSATTFFLNESMVDIGNIQSISMNDVAMVKVFRPPFFGAAGGGAGGAIAIYTKKGGGDNLQVKGLSFTNLNGYSAIREFYSPDYEKDPRADIKDYRTTLYWNPLLFLDKNTRRLTLPFFNSDNCKKFRVIIEGINEAGQLTREEKIFE